MDKELQEFDHIADFDAILKKYEENRSTFYSQGLERWSPQVLSLNIARIKLMLKETKGLTEMDKFPVFMKSLEKVVAPKSHLNVTRSMLDFVDFLIGLYGHGGPKRRTSFELTWFELTVFELTWFSKTN